MYKTIIIAGSGGQGVISVGMAIANIFMLDDKNVTFTQCYGAEMRGGAVNCTINVSDSPIYNFQNEKVDILIAFNQISLDKFTPKVKTNGTIIINSSMANVQEKNKSINYIEAPMSEIASSIGNIMMANSVALGVLAKMFGGFNIDNIKEVYKQKLKDNTELLEKNIKAYLQGFNLNNEVN